MAPVLDPLLEVQRIVVAYDTTVAVNDVSLAVASGGFLAVIGPSGSGKSTLLRVMAGAECPTRGRVLYRGEPLGPEDARCRDIVMVWQSLALFPFMNVEQNVAFGLRMRGVSRHKRASRATEMLDKMGLTGLGRRNIRELSGGEQQRVALARALIVDPKVLLLDEPFGALDAHLRVELADQIRDLHSTTGIGCVMVTHDQSEAFRMASTVAVLANGGVQQVGSPDDIWLRPATEFVCRFVGRRNLLEGVLVSLNGTTARVRTKGGEFAGRCPEWIRQSWREGQSVAYVVNHADIMLGSGGHNEARGIVNGCSRAGSSEVIRVESPGLGLVECERFQAAQCVSFRPREPVTISWRTEDAFIVPIADQHESPIANARSRR